MSEISKIDEGELLNVLKNSLYPDASDHSLHLVLSYCQAAGLDPMQKPVHIVGMNQKDPQTGQWVNREVIMPGIGLYRIQASRSGVFAGVTEPEFGPLVTHKFIDKNKREMEFTFPEWCKITVKKLLPNGEIGDFTAQEFWLENYATQKAWCTAPNKMWSKRSHGQIAKCAEAQALRKAFPEIGAQPTAEEMEGKTIDVDVVPEPVQEETPNMYPAEDFDKNFKAWEAVIKSGKKAAEEIIVMIESRGQLTQEQKDMILNVEVEEGATE